MTGEPGGRRVLVIDDHALVARMLTNTLAAHGYAASAVTPGTDDEILARVEQVRPWVVLLDFNLGRNRTSLPLVGPIHRTGARVVMLTATSDSVVLARCVEEGADGVLSKAADIGEVVGALRRVEQHGSALTAEDRASLLSTLEHDRERRRTNTAAFSALTRREEEVLAALAAGRTANQIAGETFTSVRTVRGHIQKVLDKLGVHTQLAAVAKANEHRWRPSHRPENGPTAR